MVGNYIFLRKYVLGLIVIASLGQVSDVLCKRYVNVPLKAKRVFGVPYDSVHLYDIQQSQERDWSSTAWQIVTSPYFAMAVNLALPVIINKVDDVRIYYWLTDEERAKVLQGRSEEQEEKRVFVEMQKTELQLRRDPRWKELTFSEAFDNERLRQQNLRQNEILLVRAELENENTEIQHLNQMLQNTSPEKRTEVQKKLDAYVNARMKVRLEKAMGN